MTCKAHAADSWRSSKMSSICLKRRLEMTKLYASR
jgi:hypothetical protein